MCPLPRVMPVFTDTNLATKSILLGEGPKDKNSKFEGMMKNTELSLRLLIKTWTTEQLFNKNGTVRTNQDSKSLSIVALYVVVALSNVCARMLTTLL
jgi:hypothetical protein